MRLLFSSEIKTLFICKLPDAENQYQATFFTKVHPDWPAKHRDLLWFFCGGEVVLFCFVVFSNLFLFPLQAVQKCKCCNSVLIWISAATCWVCTDQIPAALGAECRARNQMPGPLLLGKLLSADATHFQGLEMTFSSFTAGPRVDGTKKYRASAPQNCLRAKHPPQLERRPVSEETPFRENGMRLRSKLLFMSAICWGNES